MRPFETKTMAAIGGLAALLAFGGCAGLEAFRPAPSLGEAQAMAATASSSSVLSTKPRRLSFGTSAAMKTSVSVIGGTPPYTVSQSDARIADVTPAAKTGGDWVFSVTPVASGSTAVTVKDSTGATTVVRVTQETCAPPTPEFGQLYPGAGAANVPARSGFVFVANPSSDPLLKYVPEFFVRLVGSDNSVVIGGAFARTKATPPPGSATPPPGSVISRAAFGRLKPGITYEVYFPTAQSPCLPPQTSGSFSTSG